MAGFVQALVLCVQAGRGQHADGAGEHGCRVAEDVAKHVAGHDHIELLGGFNQLHGGVVHIHMVQRHVGVFLADFRHNVFPELKGFQHVGFVHAGDAPLFSARLAFAGSLEGNMGNALDLRAAVAHSVEGFLRTGEMPVYCGAAAARLAEVNVAGEFTDDQNVESGYQPGLQAGRIDQLLVTDGGAEVGKQAQILAQTQNGLLRAQRTVQRVVFPVAHGTKQHSIGRLGQLERGIGQRVAKCVVGGTADQGGFHLERQVQHVQHLDGLGHDFRADAVTGQDCDFERGHFREFIRNRPLA